MSSDKSQVYVYVPPSYCVYIFILQNFLFPPTIIRRDIKASLYQNELFIAKKVSFAPCVNLNKIKAWDMSS